MTGKEERRGRKQTTKTKSQKPRAANAKAETKRRTTND
jgi:hypothetical protein